MEEDEGDGQLMEQYGQLMEVDEEDGQVVQSRLI